MQGLKIISLSGESISDEEIVAAHRVANAHKEQKIGVIEITDPINDIVVRYHAYNNMAFTRGGNSIYFGYGKEVDMRCWCRGVVLVETTAPAIIGIPSSIGVVPTVLSTAEGWSPPVVYGAADGWDFVGNGVVYGSDSGGKLWNGYVHYGTFGNGGWTTRQLLTETSAYISALSAYISAVEAQNAAAQASANQRSAAFLTDGAELASIATSIANNSIINAFNAYRNIGDWSGASYAAIFDFLDQGGSNEIIRKQNLEFVVPDDACFIEVDAPFYPGSYDEVVTPEWQAEWNAGQLEGLARERTRRKACSDGQLAYLRNGFLSPEFEYFIKTRHPVSALVRRDIPMEIVSRDQQLVSDTTDADGNRTQLWSASITLKYDVTDNLGNITPIQKTFTGTVQQEDIILKDVNGTPVNETGIWRYTYTNLPMLINGNTGKAYPLPYPLPSIPYTVSLKLKTLNPIFHDDKSYPLLVEANGTFFLNEAWIENDTYNTTYIKPTYTPDVGLVETVSVGTLTPPFEKTTDNLTFTHPQFILDYIAASKPIEKELDIDGNKVPVTPSTDWLSSRLSHDEVVTVVPLSFVNAAGDDRGMYPYPQTNLNQEVIAQIKLVGFAKFKFNYFTSSFTFVNWTEFTTEGKITHDGNATYDDETNPTSVTVGETTYTLQPKYFDYDEWFGSTNCVCIGNKAIWTDVKSDAQEQKVNIADTAPEGHTLTAEERLYKAVREAIS